MKSKLIVVALAAVVVLYVLGSQLERHGVGNTAVTTASIGGVPPVGATKAESQIGAVSAAGGNKSGGVYIYLEDDLGPVDGLVFVLPVSPPNATLPERLEPIRLERGRGRAPEYVVEALRSWGGAKAVGITLVAINGTDIAIATAPVDPKAAVEAVDRGEDFEVRGKIRGKVKRDKARGGLTACPEAVMTKEDEYQTSWIFAPLFRVKNSAGVYGTFGIGLLPVLEKRFSYGIAVQEDVNNFVNFRIEPFAYVLGGQYSGIRSAAIPPTGGVVAIGIYLLGKYEVYRIDYLAADVKGCLVVDQDWLYRVYPNGVLTSGNSIVMEAADVTDGPEAVVEGSTSILYRSYTGTGKSVPAYTVEAGELAGWFYQECPGSITAPEVGAGMDLGKWIVKKAQQTGKTIADRVAKVLELIGIDVAWTGGTQTFVVLGSVSFDASQGEQFGAYFYATQAKVEIPSCGRVDLPFLYVEFK